MKKLELEVILECGHCGNKTPNVLLCEAFSTSVAHSTINPKDIFDFECSYYLMKCKTCYGVSLYYDNEFDEDRGNITEAFLCYPLIKNATEEVPSSIRQTYNEALKVEKISYTAFALLIRKALELLCKDQKATGRNLKAQLENLAQRGIIPENLSQMADALRLLGNLSAHDSYELEYSEVRAMKDFMSAMLEYVYVAPAKIKKLKDSISMKKNNIT